MSATHWCAGPVLPDRMGAGPAIASLQFASDAPGRRPDGTAGIPRARLPGRLHGSTILLVEDEAMVAMDIELALGDAGAHVLGPAASLTRAVEIVRGATQIDGAILDIDLGGEDALPLADLLTARAVPLLFHTGVGRVDQMADRFPQARLRVKPVAVEDLLGDLATLMG